MNEDIKRLLTIIKRAPSPFGKTDSELAQEYRNWFLGSRLNLKAAEQSFEPDAGDSADISSSLPSDNLSNSDGSAVPAPAQVTHTVRPHLAKEHHVRKW